MQEIKMSNNFWLTEFTKSDTAVRFGIDNEPSDEEIVKLEYLCNRLLQPIRDYIVQVGWGRSVTITSGFRCLELNRKLGSIDSSQHILAIAADFEVRGLDNLKLAKYIRGNYEFDQLILEFHTLGDPNSGWVHVSLKETGHNRQEVLTINKGVIKRGLPS